MSLTERLQPQILPEPFSGVNLELESQRKLAHYLRVKVWETVANAGSGHLGGTSSSAELFTALYFGGILRYDSQNPHNLNRDRVLVRGFLGPLRYNIFALLSWIDEKELQTYRQLGSRLQGHEVMDLVPGVDITPSGSLGMLLSYGVGSAVVAKQRRLPYRTYVFLGDGEEQEGNISEAARHAATLELDNLVCVVDRNRKQLSRPTREVDIADISHVWQGYGWEVFEIENGHNLEEIHQIFQQALLREGERPKLIIANTIKGYGLPGTEENCCGYHTSGSFGKSRLVEFVSSHKGPDISHITRIIPNLQLPFKGRKMTSSEFVISEFSHKKGGSESSLVEALTNLFKHAADLSANGLPTYVLTADLINKDDAEFCGLEGRPTFFDVGIREQHMLAMAHGISVSDPEARVIVNSNDAFLYRCADQLSAIAQGGSRVIVFADDGGLSGAHNGETHQSSGQPAAVLYMPDAYLFEPGDSQDFWRVTNWALVNNPGLVYVRLFSGEAPILPKLDDNFCFYRTFEPKVKPEVTLVSSGFTAIDAYRAALSLEDHGIPTRTVNVVNMNAIFTNEFSKMLVPGEPVLTVYNGNPLVLQSAVSSTIMRFSKEKPTNVFGHGFLTGTSGSLADLKRHFKLDTEGIIEKVREII